MCSRLMALPSRFTSWTESCFTEFGFADLKDVDSWPPLRSDKQESFVLAET